MGDALFDGNGRFKFALVNAGATQTYWRSAPDANSDGEPDAAISLPVNRGLYSVLLGDTALPNMAALPPTVFEQPAVHLRVWFDDGINGSERLSPDQRISAVGYALRAASVPDGSITASKLAPGTLDSLSGQLAAITAQLQELGSRHDALAAKVATNLPAGVTAVSADPADALLAAQGMKTFMTVPGPGWDNGSTEVAPLPRVAHSAVWTGNRWLIWGGALAGEVLSPSGAGYDPARDRWTLLSDVGAPSARRDHSAVWTGGAMLVWGGWSDGLLNDGGQFNSANAIWKPLPTQGAPAARHAHLAAWTGARMLIWGGRNMTGLLADGALYDPGAQTWTALPTANAPTARLSASGVCDGARFIVWGGLGATVELGTGGFLPLTGGATPGGWTAISTTQAPSARMGHTAVWTGQRMLVWGGKIRNTLLGDGAAFDPVANAWTALPATGAPAPRVGHVAVWTGQEMLIFGGETVVGPTASGGAYNPQTGTWRALSQSGSPAARAEATGTWTGTELLVFGGRGEAGPLAALQRLNPQPDWFFYRKP